MQQRTRPQIYFRFWFAGWLGWLLSYTMWEVPLAQPIAIQIQDSLRYNMTMAGTLLFLLSFVAREQTRRKALLYGVAIFVPAFIFIEFVVLRMQPFWLLNVMAAVGEVWAVVLAHYLLPRSWRWQRFTVFSVCVLFTVVLLVRFAGNPSEMSPDFLQAQVLLCTAVFYAGAFAKRSFAGLVGSIGFLLWGLMLVLGWMLTPDKEVLHVVWAVWSIPKYFVGFSMILNIFEDEKEEKARLAEGFRVMYEDFRKLYERHPHPMWIYDPETRCFLTANVAAKLSYGYSEFEFTQMTPEDLLVQLPAGAAEPCDKKDESCGEGLTRPWGSEHTQHRYRDGRTVWVEITDSRTVFRGRQARLLLARDITDTKRQNDELFFRANHDALTGLPNRALLGDRIQQCLVRSERDGSRAVLLTIDIDHFKSINDTHGHLVGDECLKAVSARLLSRIRQVDTLARTGGEEFTAIIGGLHTRSDAQKVGKLLLEVFRGPVMLPDCDLSVTVSIGAAMFPDDARTVEELRKLSDEALYLAKRCGRNCLRFAENGQPDWAATQTPIM